MEWKNQDAYNVIFGTLSGGIGAEIGGGNFFVGAATGLAVSYFNHLMHKIAINKAVKTLIDKIWDAYPKKSEYGTAKELYNELIGGYLKDWYNEIHSDSDPNNDTSLDNS